VHSLCSKRFPWFLIHLLWEQSAYKVACPLNSWWYAGKKSFIWFGSTPRVTILEPEQIKDVLNKMSDFPKPKSNPLVKLLATGLIDHEGEKWSKHRRLINPAFNLEKLKVSCLHFICRYRLLICFKTFQKRNRELGFVCACVCFLH